MSVFLLILSILCFAGSLALIFVREVLAPVVAFCGLLLMWLSEVVPLNSTIIIMWLGMSAIVTMITMLQSGRKPLSRVGFGYMTAGGVTGMVVGLLGISFATTASMLYGLMMVATIAGVFFGFMLYTNTPHGRMYNMASGRFFGSLLANGFPVGITIAQIGIVLVLMVWMRQYELIPM